MGVKIIDKSIPLLEPATPKVRVALHSAAGLTFVHIDFMSPKDKKLLPKLITKYRIHQDLRCTSPTQDINNKGYTAAQAKECDLLEMYFGVYEKDLLIGAINVCRIKILELLPGDIQVSALIVPSLPNPASDAWFVRVLGIMEYVLDNSLETETPGVFMNVKQWEMPENANAAFRDMEEASSEVFNMDLEARNLKIVEGNEKLPDGRKIHFIERNSIEVIEGKV
jgi:hypothetical protein